MPSPHNVTIKLLTLIEYATATNTTVLHITKTWLCVCDRQTKSRWNYANAYAIVCATYMYLLPLRLVFCANREHAKCNAHTNTRSQCVTLIRIWSGSHAFNYAECAERDACARAAMKRDQPTHTYVHPPNQLGVSAQCTTPRRTCVKQFVYPTIISAIMAHY